MATLMYDARARLSLILCIALALGLSASWAAQPKSKRKAGANAASVLYADRADAMRVADEIAERRNLDRDWVRSIIGQARLLPQARRRPQRPVQMRLPRLRRPPLRFPHRCNFSRTLAKHSPRRWKREPICRNSISCRRSSRRCWRNSHSFPMICTNPLKR